MAERTTPRVLAAKAVSRAAEGLEMGDLAAAKVEEASTVGLVAAASLGTVATAVAAMVVVVTAAAEMAVAIVSAVGMDGQPRAQRLAS